MTIIDGKATADIIKKEIAAEVEQMVNSGAKRPHLAAVLIGHDGGSETYVKNKILACQACGFESSLVRFEDDVTEAELLACIDRLNRDERVDGFIVQLPLPRHIDEKAVLNLYENIPEPLDGKAGFVKSNKGLGVVILLVLLVLIFLPLILLWLGFGFVINKITAAPLFEKIYFIKIMIMF